MFRRTRRLRTSEAIRGLVRETFLNRNQLVYPLFIVDGVNKKEEIPSMPGVFRYSLDRIYEALEKIEDAGIKGILVFGIPSYKDETASAAWDDDGIVQRAVRKIKKETGLYVITDVCMCQYTSHGHCGIVKDGVVDNDETLEYIAQIVLSHVRAGADMVAPSDMMDGRIFRIRQALDKNGYINIPIMSYSAKYASSLYGPFRDAAYSSPSFGDRTSYQMDCSNIREAMREIQNDIEEGADIVMVKPALFYLDVIRWAKDRFDVPIAAYNVSGEYSMVKSASAFGFLDERRVVMEMLTSIKRAGADIIITYFALDVAKWLKEGFYE